MLTAGGIYRVHKLKRRKQRMVERQVSTGESRIPFSLGRSLRSLVLEKSEDLPQNREVIEIEVGSNTSRICCSKECLKSLGGCFTTRISQLNCFFVENKEEEANKKSSLHMQVTSSVGKKRGNEEDFILPFSTPDSLRDMVNENDTMSIQSSLESFRTISEAEQVFGRLDLGDFYDIEV